MRPICAIVYPQFYGNDMPDITIYTRKFCGFCTAAKDLLKKKGAEFVEHDATFDSTLKSEMIQRSNGATTFPQIFIGNQHIGGCDDLYALENTGKLAPMLLNNQ